MSDSQFSPEVPEPHFEETEAAFQESLGSDFGTASIIEETASASSDEATVKRAPQMVFMPVKRISDRDHKTAGFLAVVLGIFGMHKFYLGYHEQGFLLLFITIIVGSLTFGLGVLAIWLVVVVEGVIYLSSPQQKFEQLYVEGMHPWF